MPKPIEKILIIGPSWIGDMVMAQSLFKAIKADNPDVLIDVLALAWTKPLLDRMPEVNQAIIMPITHGVFAWKERKKIGHNLRDRHYDQAIVLPNSWKSALIPWFANIPIRSGWRGEMRYGLLNDIRILDKSIFPMMVQRYVSLAYPATHSNAAPSYQAPLMIATAIRSDFQIPLTAEQKRLILCPGAEFGPAKQWPATHYAELANKLIQQNWQVLILGSQADQTIADDIVSHIESDRQPAIFNLCGKTELSDAIDLLATADMVVSNDSGLMHIAAALQKPLIAIYGPTSPSFTPPLAGNAHIVQIDVECGPCFQRICPEHHHRCMRDISDEQIVTLVKKTNPSSPIN
ncbi:MAG: lipopolysaccharide heptosyltransferase II [Gammaproteobacteria bacterium]|nr:lipopolysaccharide heptosyltransferase II [Gammaproteobacteria bacterium]MDH5591380.1 lipopolysaccharide heptosyltransferase II [Gammaproteobacteria bacterium]